MFCQCQGKNVANQARFASILVAIKDTYAKSGKPAELLQRYELTAKDIEQTVHKVAKGKKG